MPAPARRGPARTRSRAARVVSPEMGAAWLLDAVNFHKEFDELFARLGDSGGFDQLLGRLLRICSDPDPSVRAYLATLDLHTPSEWAAKVEEAHLGEWYRVLMAAHLAPTMAIECPTAARDRLPDIGWTPAEARRLAFGRELASLAKSFGDPDAAAALAAVLPLGNKGWLAQQDIALFGDRLKALEPAVFRDNQNIVPLVEEIYRVLTAATISDRVLLLPPS